jgi:competence protein ComEA
MERSDGPWRVLDDAVVAGSARVPGPVPAATGGQGETRPLPGRLPVRVVAGSIAAVVLAAAAVGIAMTGSSGGGVTVDSAAGDGSGSARPSASAAAPVGRDLVVDVQGAVPRPGIHRLIAGSRVADAIAAAGGYGPRVDANRAGRELNLAAVLHDGDRVLVPSRDDPSGSGTGGSGGGSAGSGAGTSGGGGTNGSGGSGGGPSGGLVDLNHATASELDALPGVGPATAQKIITARAEQPFATIEAVRDRKVIGAVAFDKLKDLVTVTP